MLKMNEVRNNSNLIDWRGKMRKGSSIATLSMLTPKHTIWDESQMPYKVNCFF